MPIRVLDAALAVKIAAGEVVERPSSVVKELVENAIDAGSHQVSVEIRGGGIHLIRVTDDGSGIPADELTLAFERHATSKIVKLDDLNAIDTLGFRGEALPSIAAVADVTILSRTAESESAGFARFQAGSLAETGRRGGPPGTSLTIKNLFASVPARLSFLRTASTEASHCVQVVVQYALAHPGIRFSVDVDGRSALRSPGSGSLIDAVLATYGRAVADAMIPVDSSLDDPTPADRAVRITGFVARPTVSRATRTGVSLFVNGRWIQSRSIVQAIETGMQNRLMVGRHPVAVLNLQIPSAGVDVNVHPTKAEVRILFDREVFGVTQRSIRAAFDRLPAVVAFAGFTDPAPMPEDGTIEQLGLPILAETVVPSLPPLRVIGQVGLTYIITEGPDGMYLLDQHAAHERILYDGIRDAWERGDVATQGLLDPLPIEISAEQADVLERYGDRLGATGIGVDRFGETTIVIRSAPALLRSGTLSTVIAEALDSLQTNPGEWRDRIAASVACHSAVRAGQTLTDREMSELVTTFERAGSPRTCPHGRPTIIHLSAAQLEREFGRR